MNVRQILESVFKRSKLSFVILLKSLSILLIFSYFRLGSNILKPVKNKLQTEIRKPFEYSQELEWFAMYAANVFKYDSADLLRRDYPAYADHVVDEYRECRYTIMRLGHKVFVSIRGSTTQQNWVDGLTAEIMAGRHKGYYVVAKGIAEAVNSYCSDLDDVYITGCSMGGAVSILVAELIKANIAKVWAFANPKPSQLDYGYLPVVSVHDMRDPVVYLPAFTLIARYKHQGERVAYVDGAWWVYQDCWKTDLLLSPLFISEPIDAATHVQYGERLLELKNQPTSGGEL
jgi:hypothetical protein